MAAESPSFSIVVPTYSRPRELAACLEALAGLSDDRGRFEVIVVDDGSACPPRPEVDAVSDRLEIILLSQRNAGPAAARNAGAARAQGEWVAFTDDDCAPAPDWLERLAARFAASPDRVVGGRTVNSLPDNPYSTASQLVIEAIYAHYNAEVDRARFFTTNNVALPTAAFASLGGFDTTFPLAAGEDREFSDRCERAGIGMTYAPEAVVLHAHDLTLRALWRQHFNYGRGTSFFHRARARRGEGRVAAEPNLHAELLRAPLRQPSRRVRLEALVLLTQAAYAAGFAAEELRARSSAS